MNGFLDKKGSQLADYTTHIQRGYWYFEISKKNIGIFLPKTVFNYDQLYIILSRVTSRRGLKLILCDHNINTIIIP